MALDDETLAKAQSLAQQGLISPKQAATFNPATDEEIGPQEPPEPNEKYAIMMGRGSGTWSRAMERLAQKMWKGGATDEEVLAKTGVSKGVEGLPQQELDDSRGKLRGSALSKLFNYGEARGTVGSLVDYPKLMRSYQYQNFPLALKLDPQPGGVSRMGTFPAIGVAGRTPDEIWQILLHELSHPVQEAERFAMGAAPKMNFGPGSREQPIFERLVNQLKGQMSFDDFVDAAGPFMQALSPAEQMRQFKQYRTAMQNSPYVPTLDDIMRARRGAAMHVYQRAGGEASAEGTRGRAYMTGAERKLLLPEQSMPFPFKEQFVDLPQPQPSNLFGPIRHPLLFPPK